MKDGVYSHFDFITYIMSGLLIVVIFDVITGQFGSEFIKNADLLYSTSGFPLLLLGVTAYLVGQINSTVAHMFLQELVTVFPKYGRPSAYFLSIEERHKDERHQLGKEGHRPHSLSTWFWRSFGRIQITEDTYNNLDKLANQSLQETDQSLQEKERLVFSKAFKMAMGNDCFVKTYQNQLDAFNFSRNMTMALFVCVGFLSIRACWGPIDSEFVAVLSVFFGCACLMAWRYIYLLFSFSKHVLVYYSECNCGLPPNNCSAGESAG